MSEAESPDETMTQRTYPTQTTHGSEIALPDELNQALGIAPGQLVTVYVIGQRIVLEPVDETSTGSHASVRRLLRNHFADWDAVNAFVAGERSEWEERDRLLEEDRQLILERFRPSKDS